ncbi:HNH endonuclease signature motif containing protein [Heyndrickxia ginsengihumi]|uniref:HNH endonuclease signature motif containing protein n=1 Tax=Heyndrickxia ginsengihumi TaxID=363870 RepID=UPI00046FE812|nr:HNH endonuclease signature motif containing protein [Heyndrickxia ginsengihumi]
MKPQKRCNVAGCRRLIDYDLKYCDKHKGYGDKQYNEQIRWNKDNKQYAEFYASKEWKLLRRLYIINNPLCEQCLKDNKVTQAQIVHHKIEVREDFSKRLDWDNLESLCRACHNKHHFGN